VARLIVWYLVCVYLHLLAAVLWIGHMLFWVTAGGTITKRFLSEETRKVVLQFRDEFGQIGWPSLVVLVLTGVFILYQRGFRLDNIPSNPLPTLLGVKLFLVILMIVFQCLVGPKRPVLGWVNLCIALGIIGISAVLVRPF
jgi:copper resistance protein D